MITIIQTHERTVCHGKYKWQRVCRSQHALGSGQGGKSDNMEKCGVLGQMAVPKGYIHLEPVDMTLFGKGIFAFANELFPNEMILDYPGGS